MLRIEKRKISIIFIIGTVIILFYSGFSIGKEMSKIIIEGSQELARPILTVENGEVVNISNEESRGVYEFTVKNYDENEKINEVEMEYYIEILTEINRNTKFKIYKEDDEVKFIGNKTQKFVMKKEIKQEDKYKIEIICDEQKSLNELIKEIEIKVHSEQCV